MKRGSEKDFYTLFQAKWEEGSNQKKMRWEGGFPPADRTTIFKATSDNLLPMMQPFLLGCWGALCVSLYFCLSLPLFLCVGATSDDQPWNWSTRAECCQHLPVLSCAVLTLARSTALFLCCFSEQQADIVWSLQPDASWFTLFEAKLMSC